MRRIIGLALGFVAVYVIWQVFWSSAFALWDHANNPVVPLAFLAGCALAAFYFWRRQRKRD